MMPPVDVLPKVLAFAPSDLLCLSWLRVVSRHAKECVEARWWKEQVKCMKGFVDAHVPLFGDDPGRREVAELQEAFARNVLKWVKPFLVNQPWRLEGPAEATGDESVGATGEITPQVARMNLRRALGNLSHSESLD